MTSERVPLDANSGRSRPRLEPWESNPAWHPARREAFECYRDMGPERSHTKVAAALGKSKALVGRWSMKDGWPERAGAWDAECDRARREEFMQAGTEVARAQAEDAAELRSALMAPALALRARIERLRAEGGGGEPFQDVPLAELARLTATAGRAFAQVAQVERLAHGLATDNRGGPPGQPEVERMTLGQLEEYLTGRAEAGRASNGRSYLRADATLPPGE